METKKLGLEPAFPESHKNMDGSIDFFPGMSKRFYAACAAMQGILAGELTSLRSDQHGDSAFPVSLRYSFNKEKLIKNAYQIADELLKQENE